MARESSVLEFKLYDDENPEIWRLFEKYALEAVASGRPRFSARTIIHRLRWDTLVSGTGKEYKIWNDFSVYLARKFLLKYPERPTFFSLRASNADVLTREDFDEEWRPVFSTPQEVNALLRHRNRDNIKILKQGK